MKSMRFEFSGLLKNGNKAKVEISATSLRQAEQEAKKKLKKILQTVRLDGEPAVSEEAAA